MDTYKMRIKIGPNEFEAEGEKETVLQQFEEFKQLIAKAGSGPAEIDLAERKAGPVAGTLQRLCNYDEKRKLVSLNVTPQGKGRMADAILLILLGYKELVGDEPVQVTSLKEAMNQSGLSPGRIDRISQPLLRQGLVLKGGKGKGGRYSLTNKGLAQARQLAENLLS